MAAHIALLRQQDDSDFGVDFPEFAGCVTAGETPDGAGWIAAEAFEIHVEGMNADGTTILDPSNLDPIMVDPDHADALAFLAAINVPSDRQAPGGAWWS